MKSVLIANKDLVEAEKLVEIIGQEFKVSAITSPSELKGSIQDVNLVLIDSNFTEASGIDFLAKIIKKSYLPILMITPPSDSKCAAEAITAGAYNYIVKTRKYHGVLNILIKEAIDRFDKYEQMKQTILDLKKRVGELEERLGQKEGRRGINSLAGGSGKARTSIFSDMLMRFREGEINLPSPPQIPIMFEKLLKEGAGIHEIAMLLRQDVSICSKLISISNSAYYQGIQENQTLEQALSRLGLNTTRKYVEIIYNRSLYITQKKRNMELMERLWKHSVCCAYASQITCETTHTRQAEEVFTMGLFHDIGKMILLQIFSELDVDLVDGHMSEADRLELSNSFALNHGNFGAVLLKRWGFSDLYQQIALFHDNLENADPISKDLLIVHFGNLLAKTLGYCWEGKAEPEIEKAQSTSLLKISPESIKEIQQKVIGAMEEIKPIF
ncbi:MAG: HDOD domain-containing protein [Acidobacteria bacterium]|nr:HDOD domain-containing protein [Acidobacteriota bacterium]